MRDRRSPLIQRFYPSLDGLRCLAFLAVFAFHAGISAWGWVGVDVFFVLSGFLITGILSDSLGSAHFFRNFYIRRSLRIFPLYFAFWLCVLLITPVFHVQWNRYLVSTALYFGNLFMPGGFTHQHADGATLIFRNPPHTVTLSVAHLWSLCVEEQFYLIWPLIVWMIRRNLTLLRICLAYIALVPLARLAFVLGHQPLGGHVLYLLTPFRVDSLLAGAALARSQCGCEQQRLT